MKIAIVKFIKGGKDYKFLIGEKVDIKELESLKKNHPVIVKSKKIVDKNKKIFKIGVAFLQEVKEINNNTKNKPTSYLVKIANDKKYKFLTSQERNKLNKEYRKIMENKEV